MANEGLGSQRKMTTVGQMLEFHQVLLHPRVNAAHTYADVLAVAERPGNDSAPIRRMTFAAMLRQAAVRELAARGLPPETPISDALEHEIEIRTIASTSKEAAEADAPEIVNHLLGIRRDPDKGLEPSEETRLSMDDAVHGYGYEVDLDQPLGPQLEEIQKEIDKETNPKRKATDAPPTPQS